MRMKKWSFLALTLALVFMLGGLAAAHGEEAAVYKLGDKVEDFTVTLSDGQEVSLYGLLAEKKAVVLNFWASWCGPCQMEFPYLQEAYDQLSGDVGMIALSIFDGDSNEAIEAFKPQHGITTLPMGRDIGLAKQYGVDSYPTTFIIDKNGVICLVHNAMLTSTSLLTNALSTYTAGDYSEPVLLEELPPLPVTQAADAEALSAALNAPGGTLEFVSMEGEELWPFVPSQDGSCAVASNTEIQGSVANALLEVEVKAGDVLVYECQMSGAEYDDRLVVFMDTTPAVITSGNMDWTAKAFRFETEGTHQITIAYNRGRQAGYTAACALRGVRLLTGGEAAAYELPVSNLPQTLSGTELAVDVPEDARKVLTLDASGAPIDPQAIMYITNSDTALLKLRIGADVDVNFAAVTVINNVLEQRTTMLTSLEHDGEGFLFPVDLTRSSVGTFVTLKANAMDAAAPTTMVSLGASEAACKMYMQMVMGMAAGRATQEELDSIGYFGIGYEDGAAFYTSEEIFADLKKQQEQEAGQQAAASAKPFYKITFTDAAGKPLQNVMAQICDEATCTLLPSDENGVVSFEGEDQTYELHVLMVPSGYQRPEDTYALPEAGGEMTIVLETLVP